MENIAKIFNSEDEIELKQAFKNIIIDQFKNDMEALDVYLFDSSIINDMIQEVFQEIIEEVKLNFSEKIKQQMEDILSSNLNNMFSTKI